MFENKNGQNGIGALPAILFLGFFVLILLGALLSPMVSVMNLPKQSDVFNCPGFVFNGDKNSQFSYNSSLPTDSLGCTAVSLGPSLIGLGIIIAIVMAAFYGRGPNQQDQGGYQQ